MFAYNLWQWIAFFILQVIAFETVERSLRAKAQGSIVDSCMVRFFRFTDLVL